MTAFFFVNLLSQTESTIEDVKQKIFPLQAGSLIFEISKYPQPEGLNHRYL